MLEMKVYTAKICRFTRQVIREERPPGQGWKTINFLGGPIFSQTWLLMIFFNQITNFTKSCFCLSLCRFYKNNWMNFWWCGTVGMSCKSSGSRWCSCRNISYALYSGFAKSRNLCRKTQNWCKGRCFRSKFTDIVLE